jgi:hypothetical protein
MRVMALNPVACRHGLLSAKLSTRQLVTRLGCESEPQRLEYGAPIAVSAHFESTSKSISWPSNRGFGAVPSPQWRINGGIISLFF